MGLSIYLVFFGLSLIALSYKKHYMQIFNKDISKKLKYLLIAVGNLILIISLFYLINEIGLILALIYWTLVLTPAIIFIALAFSYNKPSLAILFIVLSVVSTGLNLLGII